jgi:hypothetical protein
LQKATGNKIEALPLRPHFIKFKAFVTQCVVVNHASTAGQNQGTGEWEQE